MPAEPGHQLNAHWPPGTIRRHVRSEDDIDAEIAGVKELSGRHSSWRELLDPPVRHVMVLGGLLAVFQQITGINTIIYYAPTLLASAGLGSSAALLANVVNGGVNVLMTIVAIRLLDRSGRRPLLLSGTAGMSVGMLVIGTRSETPVLSSCSAACRSWRWPTSSGRCRRRRTHPGRDRA